LTVDQCYEW